MAADPVLEEPNLRITEAAVITPDDEYPLAGITAVERRTYKPFLVPLALGVFGTINAVIAVQSGLWDILVAAVLMLGGGMYWRHRATRHLLRVEHGGKMETIWQTRDEASRERAAACLEKLLAKRR